MQKGYSLFSICTVFNNALAFSLVTASKKINVTVFDLWQLLWHDVQPSYIKLEELNFYSPQFFEVDYSKN